MVLYTTDYVSSDSQSKAGVPIFARYPGFENLMFCGNLNLTGAKFGPVISGFVENGLAGRPDFGFEKELDTHSQPALLTDKTFQEVEEGATKELETLEREEAL